MTVIRGEGFLEKSLSCRHASLDLAQNLPGCRLAEVLCIAGSASPLLPKLRWCGKAKNSSHSPGFD